MRRLTLTFLFLLLLTACALAPPTKAAPTLVQITACSGNAYGGANPVSCTLNGIGANHLLVVAAYSCGPSTFSDTFGFTWTTIGGGAVNATSCNLRQRRADLYCVLNGSTTGTDTVSNTMASVTVSESIIFAEYSGVKPTGTCPDAPPGASGGGTTGNSGGAGTITGATLTTNVNGDLFIAVGATSSATTLTAGAGFVIEASVTNSNEDGSGTTSNFYLEDKVVGAAGTYNATFSQSGAALWEIMSAAFLQGGVVPAKRKHPPYIVYRRRQGTTWQNSFN